MPRIAAVRQKTKTKANSFVPKSVRLAICTADWQPADPSTTSFPIEQCLSQASDAGYAGVEVHEGLVGQVDNLPSLLARNKMELVAGRFVGNLGVAPLAESKERLEKFITLLTSCKCALLIYAEQPPANFDTITLAKRVPVAKEGQANYAARLNELARFAKRRGVKIAYHPQLGSPVQTLAEITALMNATSNDVGLVVDTGTTGALGENPGAVLRKLSARVRLVRIVDVRKELLSNKRTKGLALGKLMTKGLLALPGEGSLNLMTFFKDMGNNKYGGWLVAHGEAGQVTGKQIKDAIWAREFMEPCLDEYNIMVLDEQQ